MIFDKNLVDYVYSEIYIGNITAQISIFMFKLLVVIISAVASLEILGFFIVFINKPNKFFDIFFKKVMGIYLIHYTVVSIYQLSAFVKK